VSVLALAQAVAALITPILPGNAVTFADARHGWAGGRGGIIGTSDGGRSWRGESRTPVGEITALDATHAWALTDEGFVLRTTDGRAWRPLGAPHLVRVQFVDRLHGFGLERDGVVVRSSDGGRSWPQVSTPRTMQAECFSNVLTGWVARGGSIWGTRDGGKRWTRKRLLRDGQGYPIPELGCRGGDVWVLFHGGAATSHEEYEVFRSLNGGSTWRHVLTNQFTSGLHLPEISAYSGPFSVLGHGAAVFLGRCDPCDGYGTATVVSTTDGGATFRRTTPFYGYAPEAVSFVDRRHGWLLTGAHVASAAPAHLELVWRTSDGGRTWKLIYRSPLVAS